MVVVLGLERYRAWARGLVAWPGLLLKAPCLRLPWLRIM